MEILESGRRNIVVLGAGFGGITALLKLHDLLSRHRLFPRYNLVLVNKNEQHLYTPALYEVAAIPRGEAGALCLKSAICIAIQDILERFPHIRFIGEEVASLDPRTRIINLKSGSQLNFEYVVVALGSETNFFGIPGLQNHACPLKTFEDAVRLRNRAEELLGGEKGIFHVVVGGGGSTGVEVAAEAVNFFRRLREAGGSAERRESIVIVESSPEILPGFSPDTVRKTKKRLKKLGVKMLGNAAIVKVFAAEIYLNNEKSLPYDLLIWAGGVKPASVLRHFGLELDRKGGVAVNEFLEARPGIYAVGDCASFPVSGGKTLPKNVPVAEGQARLAARNILADILGRPKQKHRPLDSYPFILMVGGKYAVTDLVIAKFFGFAGWALKQIVELRYLLFILPRAKAIAMWLRTVYYSTRND